MTPPVHARTRRVENLAVALLVRVRCPQRGDVRAITGIPYQLILSIGPLGQWHSPCHTGGMASRELFADWTLRQLQARGLRLCCPDSTLRSNALQCYPCSTTRGRSSHSSPLDAQEYIDESGGNSASARSREDLITEAARISQLAQEVCRSLLRLLGNPLAHIRVALPCVGTT